MMMMFTKMDMKMMMVVMMMFTMMEMMMGVKAMTIL